MANQFLVEIHDFISRQIDACRQDRAEAQARGDANREAFKDGKIHEFERMRTFLSAHFDLSTQKYY